ncbi:MAG: RHS repeat domain-containing protein [Limisphaerales bacterium]
MSETTRLLSTQREDPVRRWPCYDGLMRKRIEQNFTWNGSGWTQTNETLYVYDGILVLQERDGNDEPMTTYTRGIDLLAAPESGVGVSGTLQGAGGIGGLLARSDNQKIVPAVLCPNNPNPQNVVTSYYFSDGRGNVIALVSPTRAVLARYEYDPFGNLISKNGPMADMNKYRFSSKEWEGNAGLYYYGYRFYDPNLQRWVNRDPLDEPGFETLQLVNQPLLMRKLRLGINDSEVRFFLAMALQSGVSGGPNWPAELLETPNLFNFIGNGALNGIDPYGLEWHSYNPGSWDWGMIWDWLKTVASAANDRIDNLNMANDTLKCGVQMYGLLPGQKEKDDWINSDDPNDPIPIHAD